MDRYVVLKLVSSEEVVATQIEENDYEVKVLFPMLVKYLPKLIDGKLMETITLAPLTHFAADDQFDFQKNQIIFLKDLSERHVNSYKLAVDDFVANSVIDEPQSVEDLKATLDRLAETFSDQIQNIKSEEDIITDSIFVNMDNKTIN